MTMGISLCCSYLTAAARHDREAIDTVVGDRERCTRTDTHLGRVQASFAFAVIVYGRATRVNGSFYYLWNVNLLLREFKT
jgi:hypothetical protein